MVKMTTIPDLPLTSCFFDLKPKRQDAQIFFHSSANVYKVLPFADVYEYSLLMSRNSDGFSQNQNVICSRI